MNKRSTILAFIVVFVVAAALIAIFGSKNSAKDKTNETVTNVTQQQPSEGASKTTPPTSDSPIPPVPTQSETIAIQDMAFNSKDITIKVGTKVTWTNNDSAKHTVTSDSASDDSPASAELAKGESYSFTFMKVGVYHYHCSLHSGMTGTVTVTE